MASYARISCQIRVDTGFACPNHGVDAEFLIFLTFKNLYAHVMQVIVPA
jgi:hypothetical protein